MGADTAIHLNTKHTLNSLQIAKCLKEIVKQQSPDLIILGRQSIHYDSGQTGQMLAALCDYPQATFASKVDIQAQRVIVKRNIDGGPQTIAMPLPAIITAELKLNEPRFASLPNIMKARKKNIEVIELESLNINLDSKLTLLKVTAPAPRKEVAMVNNVNELISKLKVQEKVIL